MKIRVGALLLFWLAAVACPAASKRILRRAITEKMYSEDDKAFTSAQPLSEPTLLVLLKTIMGERDARSLLAQTDAPGRPGILFNAIPVHLKNTGDHWLLAVGTAPPTSGADNGHFWVMNLSGPQPNATFLAPANYVELLKTRTNGYRDLRSVWCSPNQCEYKTFVFSRGRYRQILDRWTKNY
jgi:hypothetical protein